MVKFITYKEKKYPVKVGYYVIKMLKAETGKEIEQVLSGDNMDITVFEILLFYAMKQGAKYTETEFTFEKEDMEMILDDCFFEFLELIPSFFPHLQQKPQAPQNKKK